MRIFDGVELKPALSPTMQGAISWALLIANTLIEAGKSRDERLASEAGKTRPTTLDQVMQQSGLRIPGIEEALEQLMGGTEEAKQAAELLVNNPDPAVLLQKFAEHFGLKITTEAELTSSPAPSTAPPAVSPTRPPAASTPPAPRMATQPTAPTMTAPALTEPPQFRADFTRKASEAAANTTDASALRPPQFRADFTREAREAAKATASASPPTSAPRSPEPAKATASASPPTSAPRSPEPAVSRPSLIEMVEHQLAALRRRMVAHQAEIDERLARAEFELDALRERLRELLAARRPLPLRAVPPQTMEPVPSPVQAAIDAPTVEEPPVAPAHTNMPERLPAAEGAVERIEDVAEPLLLAATEDEVASAVELVGAFGDENEAQHRQSAARLTRVEHELHVMRVLVARTDAGGEDTDGEAQPEGADAVHG
ncbi:hypothetical protein [Nannocystis pusilla]|uniref:Uncharacterized protein n=1 Tax=Nannocystis pusilla TaxID=889268 RepID=A0ABS7TMB9_9BACT|nr:hypothetical protein [Nannocystis pusilla]MBZ5709365.1 hypothetical protein [Nannocystis pusilla]